MKRIALVADSTADLTAEICRDHDVHIIPLKVRFGDQEYYDHELSGEEFYRRLAESDELPKTSQPTPHDFSELYHKLLDEYHEVVSVHIASSLSGTINAARLAKEKLKGKVHIIDSKTISLGFGLMVTEAARHIREGVAATEIAEKLSKARSNIETMFTLNTLEYLQKGGRIGRVQGLMGSLLNLKPIIRVGDDGVYQSYGRARGQDNALKGIVNAMQELANGRKPIHLAVAHGAAYEAALSLKNSLENAFEIKATMFTQVGPVIGVHTGPGTIGAAIQYEG